MIAILVDRAEVASKHWSRLHGLTLSSIILSCKEMLPSGIPLPAILYPLSKILLDKMRPGVRKLSFEHLSHCTTTVAQLLEILITLNVWCTVITGRGVNLRHSWDNSLPIYVEIWNQCKQFDHFVSHNEYCYSYTDSYTDSLHTQIVAMP